ncbi:MAG: tetratricopeptide repeat protein, partial [Chthoniobacteraceae bacterium]|nr:tetratricopeptide repeat protein [Chthoniobacteraceae bacterium]
AGVGDQTGHHGAGTRPRRDRALFGAHRALQPGRTAEKGRVRPGKALKSDSKDGEFWSQLAELCTRLDVQEGGKVLPEKLRRLNSLFQKALACDPGSPDTMVKAADFYYETRQFEPAIPLYRKAIATEDEPASEDALGLRDKLARALMDGGHRDQALEVLQKMAADAPQRVGTQALLGDIHLLDGRVEEALVAYREVIRLDPSIAPAYLRVADLEMRLGHSEQALSTLGQARKRFPGTALVTYSLAVTLSQAHQYAEALKMFEETLREAPASKPELPNASFYFAYGMAAEQAGDLERAAALLQKSIALDQANAAPARNYLGYMWIEHGVHLQEAGELVRRALVQEPKNGAYLDSLGWYYFVTGDYPQAVANLLKAVAALPEPDAVVLEHLGDAYAATGERAKAVDAWKKALELDAGNKALPAKISKAQGKP